MVRWDSLATAGTSSFSGGLHAELVRVSWPPGPVREWLLDLLCDIAPWHKVADPRQNAWVLPAMKELLESLLSSGNQDTLR